MGEYEPFTYRVLKSGEVHVRRGGRVVTVLRGPSADALAVRLGEDPARDQELLQRATGNYRRGNKRR